jgi:hypothetical protein
MYQYEEVKNEEGLSLAKELKSIYQRTSAKETSGGIDELFRNIGKKFLVPNSDITSNLTKEEIKSRGEKIMRDNIKNQNNKKKCC